MTDKPREPDPFTDAWWKKQFRGMQNYINLLSANCEDAYRTAQAAEESMAQFQEQRAELMAKIGEIQERLNEVVDRQDKMASWIKEKWSSKQTKSNVAGA